MASKYLQLQNKIGSPPAGWTAEPLNISAATLQRYSTFGRLPQNVTVSSGFTGVARTRINTLLRHPLVASLLNNDRPVYFFSSATEFVAFINQNGTGRTREIVNNSDVPNVAQAISDNLVIENGTYAGLEITAIIVPPNAQLQTQLGAVGNVAQAYVAGFEAVLLNEIAHYLTAVNTGSGTLPRNFFVTSLNSVVSAIPGSNVNLTDSDFTEVYSNT